MDKRFDHQAHLPYKEPITPDKPHLCKCGGSTIALDSDIKMSDNNKVPKRKCIKCGYVYYVLLG